jgi:hypothetical protein
VSICAPAADEHHVLGTVTEVALRERGYEHAMHLRGENMITGVLAAARVRRGETVGLRLEPSGCMVFAYNGPVVGARRCGRSVARHRRIGALTVQARATKMTDDLIGGAL